MDVLGIGFLSESNSPDPVSIECNYFNILSTDKVTLRSFQLMQRNKPVLCRKNGIIFMEDKVKLLQGLGQRKPQFCLLVCNVLWCHGAFHVTAKGFDLFQFF